MNRELLHLTWDSPDNPWCGGGGAYRDYTILGMLEGWDRTIWSGKHPNGSEAPMGCLRQGMGTGMLGELVSRRSWAMLASPALRRRLAQQPGLVVSQSASAWAPVWEGLLHPYRILHVVHHVAGESILKRLGPLGPSSYRFEQRLLAEGHYYATPNRATASRIRAVNPQARIEIIPNGFLAAPGADAARNPESAVRTIAFLGRMDHQMKGLDRLLAAFAQVGQRHPQARLLLLGRSDASMDAWRARALAEHPCRDRVDVVTNPSDQEKYRQLDRADVFCVPSRFEGWCIAAIEAQSRGLPVVATRTDGLLDSVQDGETGLLVSNEEDQAVPALAEALCRLLEDDALRLRLGVAAIPWANRFTWEAATAATETLLEEIRQQLPR